MFGSVSSPREGSARKPLAFPSPTVPEVRSKSWYWWYLSWWWFYDDGYKRPISSLCVVDAYVTYLFLFVMMFVGMVTNLILCINYEIEELRLMMKTRLLPGQRKALALINPALFLIIQRCLRHFSLRSSKMCFHPGPNPKGHNLVELLHRRHWSKV